MALLCRIKEAKLNNIFNHFKRHCFQIHTPRQFSNHTSPRTISDYFRQFQFTNAPKNQAVYRIGEVFNDSRVRFFAAPVQFLKPKVEVKQFTRPRLNDEIKNVEFVRLVTDEGHDIISIKEAQQRAKELGLDLVEVDRVAKPPVCKVVDYNREKYKRKVFMKERAKMKSAGSLKTGSCKEVRFSSKAELKDIKIKADAVKKLVERGYRVKCSVLPAEGEDISGLLSQIVTLIEDVAVLESEPKIEKRQGFFIARHIKFASKKGNKPSKGLRSTDSEIQMKCPTSDSTVNSVDQAYAGESVMDSYDEEFDVDCDNEVEAPLHGQDRRSWSVSSASNENQDFEKLFDVGKDLKGANISHDKQMRFDSGAASAVKSDRSKFMPSQAPSLPENRYARKVPNNASAMRNPVRSPNHGSQPHPHSHVYPPGGPRRVGSESSSSNSFRQNENGQPRGEIPNRARQPGSSFSPPAESQRPPINHTPNSTGFGMFSGKKASVSGNSEPGIDVNQQRNDRQSNFTRNPTVRGNIPPPTSKSDGGVAGDNKKWGLFSGENSNSVPGSS